MFRLRTLGTLDLVGPDGRELRAVLAQPKRTALLVYLALASPRGFHRRDTLAGLLWPELDAPRARAALSTAVYNLRRALGADVLLGRGVEELGLEFGRVWCDAAAFDEAVRAGDLEAALDLYGGALLPGLHLDGAPEWERWLERERGRLRERARAAAWTLAERAEQADDLPQAAAWWQRALLLAAGDERTHRHLIALLDRSGDRAGALREYDALARWLRTEFETEPSTETRALIRAVRARSPGAAPEAASTEPASTGAASAGAVGPERTGLAEAPPTAARDAPRDASVPADPPVLPAAPSPPEPVSPALLPTPAPAAGAPAGRTPPRAPRRWRRAVAAGVIVLVVVALGMNVRWAAGRALPSAAAADVPAVAVFPFAFHGNDAYAFLADGAARLLSTRFTGVGDLRPVEYQAVAQLAARASGPLRPDEARAMARQVGADRFVLGEVTEIDGRVRIVATLHDAAMAAAPRSATATGSAGEALALVEQLVAALWAQQSPAGRSRLAAVALRSTRSDTAGAAFLRGEAHYRAGRFAAAVEEFSAAAAADTGFALALYRLSNAANWIHQDQLTRASAARAARHGAALPPEDRQLVEAWNAYLRGDPETAERLYRAVLAVHADEQDAWFYLGETLFHWMPMLGRPASESREAWERVLRTDPTHAGAIVHLARLEAAAGHRAEFDALAARLRVLQPNTGQALELRALGAFAFGTAAEQDEIARALALRGSLEQRAVATAVAVHAHNLEGAARLARLLTTPAPDPEGPALNYLLRAEVELARGRMGAAGGLLDSAAALSPALAAQYRAMAATLPWTVPDPTALAATRATIQSPAIAADGSPSALRAGPWALYLAGVAAVHRGDAGGALAAAARLDTASGTPSDVAFARDYARLVRAEVARARGGLSQALDLLGAPHVQPGWTLPTVLSYPKAHERWLRAELLRDLGRHAEALRLYRSFPDPAGYDLMYLAPARRREAELLERAGQTAAAAHGYGRVVRLWREAEPALRAETERAQRAAARLAGPAR